MGSGVSAKKFFDQQEKIPYYVQAQVDYRNKQKQQTNLQRQLLNNRSFNIESHFAQFQEFNGAEVSEEFYKIAKGQKLDFNKFIEISYTKYPHVAVPELAEYLLTDKQLIDTKASQSTAYSYVTKPVSREDYIQINYVMQHWKIVEVHPIFSLFLFADEEHHYQIKHSKLCEQFILHFGTTDVQYMRAFRITKKQFNQYLLYFQTVISSIRLIEQQFYELNPFIKYNYQISDLESESENYRPSQIITAKNRVRVQSSVERKSQSASQGSLQSVVPVNLDA